MLCLKFHICKVGVIHGLWDLCGVNVNVSSRLRIVPGLNEIFIFSGDESFVTHVASGLSLVFNCVCDFFCHTKF